MVLGNYQMMKTLSKDNWVSGNQRFSSDLKSKVNFTQEYYIIGARII